MEIEDGNKKKSFSSKTANCSEPRLDMNNQMNCATSSCELLDIIVQKNVIALNREKAHFHSLYAEHE